MRVNILLVLGFIGILSGPALALKHRSENANLSREVSNINKNRMKQIITP